ncbi:MAG: hypothetical protein AAF304_04375 [Pseudomonadota bacterium]
MIDTEDPEEIKYVQKLFQSAEEGDLEALYKKGALFDMGDLVKIDKVKASLIFKEAADKGHSHSMWIHACELLWGKGNFPQSIKDGMHYLNRAIEIGSAQACITKARLHLFGELGVDKDISKSNEFRKLAQEFDKDIYDPLSSQEYVERIKNSISGQAT